MTTNPRIAAASSALAREVGSGDPADLWITDAEIAIAAADAVMFSEEAVEQAVENLLAGDYSYCPCRSHSGEKHDVNPPCETRREADRTVRSVIASLRRGEA